MYSFARVLLQPGSVPGTLFAGDIVGRGPSSALPIQDPRVHEAHAVVSFRDGELCLLPARGALYLDGGVPTLQPVVLRAGLQCRLRRDGKLKIEVLAVRLAPVALALELEGKPPVLLRPGSTYALRTGSVPWLIRGAGDEADAAVWMEGEEWFIRAGDGVALPVELGSVLTLACGQEVRGVPVAAAVDPTRDTNVHRVGAGAGTPLHFDVERDHISANWVIRAQTKEGRVLDPLNDVCACFVGHLMSAYRSGTATIAKASIVEGVWRTEPHQNLPSGPLYHAKRRAVAWLAGLPGGMRTIRRDGTDGMALVLHPQDTISVMGETSRGI